MNVLSTQNPIILNTHIRRDSEGRFCLNDLHKAAGCLAKHKPSEWLRNKQTVELIEEVEKAGIPAIQSKQQLGTFALKPLVYSYAMWISPAFHLKVIMAFDAMVSGTGLTEQQNKQIALLTENNQLKSELLDLYRQRDKSLTVPNAMQRARYWTPEDDAVLIEHRQQGLGAGRICKNMGRSYDSVRHRMRRLGV
jgi:hypothetical protein